MDTYQTAIIDKNRVTIISAQSFFILTALIIYKQFLLGITKTFYLHLGTDLGFLTLIALLSIRRNSRLLQNMQNTVVFLLILYNFIDICVILAIHQRFTLENFIAHYRDVREIYFFLTPKLTTFCIAVLLAFICLWKRNIVLPVEQGNLSIICCVLLFIFFLGSFFLNPRIYEAASNTAIHIDSDSFRPNSVTSSTLKVIRANYPILIQRIQGYFDGNEWKHPIPANVNKPNVIIVLSESLSAVDSRYSGGLFNRLPNIDKIQEQGLALTNMVSNGKISDSALASLLLGLHPIKTGGYTSVLDHFPPNKFFENNVIAYANKAGYKTILVGGHPQRWQGLTKWFKEVGFSEVYDSESSVFSNLPRFTWNAPSDEALYKVAENLASQESGPYLILVETISLHHPYILPSSHYRASDSDLLNQVHYVDVTTYNFYQNLSKQDFFKNGTLLVLGDHRRFEPLEKEEMATGGFAKWHQRVVAFLVGKNVVSRIKSNIPMNLSDLNYLLHYIIQGKVINEDVILHSNLATQIGIKVPFNISLADEFRGQYLIRSNQYSPLYLSIWGNFPFDTIPYDAYKEVAVFLVMNDQWTNEKLGLTPMASVFLLNLKLLFNHMAVSFAAKKI